MQFSTYNVSINNLIMIVDSNRVTSDKNVSIGVNSAKLHGWAHNLPELPVPSLKFLVHQAQLVQGADQ